MDDRWRNNSLETINCFSCGLKLAKTLILKTPNFKSGSNLIALSSSNLGATCWTSPGHTEQLTGQSSSRKLPISGGSGSF